MNIQTLKTKRDYLRALKKLELIFDAPANSPEGEEADILSLLIEDYENKHYAIEAPDPIEAIKIRMEEMD